MSELLSRIQQDMKEALRAGDKRRLGVVRLILAAVQQYEVAHRSNGQTPTIDDKLMIALLDKMQKERRDSLAQYEAAGRDDLASQEAYEAELIQSYLPKPLSEAEISQLIEQALTETGAQSMREMGQVMGKIKPLLQGRADMSAVSKQIKERLS